MTLGSIRSTATACAALAAHWARSGLDLVYPPACALCGELAAAADAGAICDDCRLLLVDPRPACPRCAALLPVTHGQALACPACARRPPRFDAAVTLGRYEGALRETILRTKHRSEEPLVRALSRLLASERWPEIEALRPSCVVPIPMHWSRRLLRGVNSPETVARFLAKKLEVPMNRRLLRRIRRTQPQTNLTPWQRRRNVRRAFRAPASARLTGARVLLVDDIMTTGATANEATATLRRQEAEFVGVVVLARPR